MHTLSILAACLLAGSLSTGARAAAFVPLDPKATYLLTYQDAANATPALLLSDFGFGAGDRMLLEVVGDMDNGPGGDTFTFTLGLFSSSDVLLDSALLDRVPGALVSDGPEVITSRTFNGSKITDIPQDFGFDKPDGVIVTVPVGATHLFLAKHDQLYHDNSDPDHDYGVLISLAPVPEPATWALWLAGAAWLGARARQRRPSVAVR